MLRAGTPATDVADHLGHGLGVLQDTYAHAIKDMKGKRAQPLDKAISAKRVRPEYVGKKEAGPAKR
jgi:hypothetical protein